MLSGPQVFHYPDGRKLWEVTYAGGRKTGTETWWSESGHKEWEKTYAADGAWDWKLFDRAGRLTAESKWKGKDLVEASIK